MGCPICVNPFLSYGYMLGGITQQVCIRCVWLATLKIKTSGEEVLDWKSFGNSLALRLSIFGILGNRLTLRELGLIRINESEIN